MARVIDALSFEVTSDGTDAMPFADFITAEGGERS